MDNTNTTNITFAGAFIHDRVIVPLFKRGTATLVCVTKLNQATRHKLTATCEFSDQGRSYNLAEIVPISDKYKQAIINAVENSYVVPLTTLLLNGITIHTYVSADRDMYMSASDVGKLGFTRTVTSQILYEQGRVSSIRVIGERDVRDQIPKVYSSAHSEAMDVVAIQHSITGTTTLTQVSKLPCVTTSDVTVALYREQDNVYISATGVLMIAQELGTPVCMPACELVNAGSGNVAVMHSHAFVRWYLTVTNRDTVRDFVSAVNNFASVFVEMPADKPADKPLPTPCPYNYVIMNLASSWIQSHTADGLTPQEYQQNFLSDCSAAASLAKKSPFKITFS